MAHGSNRSLRRPDRGLRARRLLRRRLAAGRARPPPPELVLSPVAPAPYTLRGYVGRRRADERLPHVLGGVVGARARLRALRHRAGLGAARPAPAGARRPRLRVRSALATGLGAASSSCSYAAIAIAKSMFAKGASLVSAMTFQFASTNLVFELGLVLWLFLGWRFTLAEFVGGIVLIALMWLRAARSRSAAARRRRRASGRGSEHRPSSITPRATNSSRCAEKARLAAGVVGRRAQLSRRLGDAVEGDRRPGS